jgi:dienelactone hydrolase
VTNVVIFHHAQGLTPGIREFATRLGAAGHVVTAPDLFEGKTFDSVAAGVAFAEQIGFDNVLDRGKSAAESLEPDAVYIGFSLGVLPAQLLAQTRAGARGAVLVSACVPVSEFGPGWPAGVPVQVHGMDRDEFFAGEGDLEAARALVESTPDAELFLYPGSAHLFADPSTSDYVESAAVLFNERVDSLLAEIDA